MTSSDRRGCQPLTLDLGVTRRLVEWREALEARPTSPDRDRELGNIDHALADDVQRLLAVAQECARLRLALDAIARAHEPSGGCAEGCARKLECGLVVDCDCGYIDAADDPAAFARAALRGEWATLWTEPDPWTAARVTRSTTSRSA